MACPNLKCISNFKLMILIASIAIIILSQILQSPNIDSSSRIALSNEFINNDRVGYMRDRDQDSDDFISVDSIHDLLYAVA